MGVTKTITSGLPKIYERFSSTDRKSGSSEEGGGVYLPYLHRKDVTSRLTASRQITKKRFPT